MKGASESVILTGVANHDHFFAQALQASIKLFALADREAQVVFAMEQWIGVSTLSACPMGERSIRCT